VTQTLPLADPEIAAAVFRDHLMRSIDSAAKAGRDWAIVEWVDDLHAVVRMWGRLGDAQYPHFILLGAEHYDLHPPRVRIVDPRSGWSDAAPGTKYFPIIDGCGWFQLHPTYQFADAVRQLACFSYSADYYVSGHTPTDEQRWQQGRHTVSATLTRLHRVLGPEFYRGRGSDA